MNYLFPLGFYVMMGVVMTSVNPGFKDFMIPAMIIFSSMASNLLGLPSPIVESREAGIYRSFKINGVPAISILSAPLISTIIHCLIASAIIAVTATPLFHALPPTNWGYLALITILTAITFGTLGALIGVISTGSRSVVLFSQLIFLPSILLSGLMIPLGSLPKSIQTIAGLFPSTYAMQAFQNLAFGLPTVYDPLLSVGVLTASSLLAFILAIFLFNWDSRNKTSRGNPLMALFILIPYLIAIILQP
jgi:ABC-2 type transport system permease protein